MFDDLKTQGLVDLATEKESKLTYRTISDEQAAEIMGNAFILKADPIAAPLTDGWLLLVITGEYGLLYLEIDDLIADSAEPDHLTKCVDIKAAVVVPGKKQIRYLI